MKRLLPFAVLLVAAACSDLGTPLAPTSESESVVLSSRSAAAKASKVNVCHVDDMGKYRLINVSANALKAHLGHGDGLPGEGGFGLDCSVVVDPFAFGDLSLVFFEESFYQIAWTVTGTPSPVSFNVDIFYPDPFSGGFWSTQETVAWTGASSYVSLDPYGAGIYRIVAVFSDLTTVESASITIGTPTPPPGPLPSP